MKTLMTICLTAFAFLTSLAQNDKMYLHKGGNQEVKIIKTGEWSIEYSYPGETATQIISKYAVAKIVYGSGRTEAITDKIMVSSSSDWENVIILEDKAAIVGLKKLGDVSGKTSGMLAVHTAGSADKKSMKKLKEDAAEMGARFVLVTSDKDNMYTRQSVKKGIAYGY